MTQLIKFSQNSSNFISQYQIRSIVIRSIIIEHLKIKNSVQYDLNRFLLHGLLAGLMELDATASMSLIVLTVSDLASENCFWSFFQSKPSHHILTTSFKSASIYSVLIVQISAWKFHSFVQCYKNFFPSEIWKVKFH